MPDKSTQLMFRRERKNLPALLLCCLLVAGTALVFAIIGDAPHALVIALIGLGLSLATRKPVPRTTRTYVYAGVIVAALTVLQNQVFQTDDTRFFLLPGELYCPAVIFLGMVLTFFDQRETTVCAIIGCSLLGMLIAGNTLGALQPNTRFTIGGLALANFHVFYAIVSLLQVIAALILTSQIMPRLPQRHFHRRYVWRRVAIVAAALIVSGIGATAVSGVALHYSSNLQRMFRSMFQRYMMVKRRDMVFDTEVNLWETLDYKGDEGKAIILRARAERAPGYLRGRAYDRYRNGRWNSPETKRSLVSELPEGRVTYTIFTRPGYPPGDDAVRIELLPAGSFRTGVVPVPGTAAEFELVADDMKSDADGTLMAVGWDASGGCTILARPYPFTSAFPAPWPRTREEHSYWEVPDNLETEVAAIAENIFAGHQEAGARAKINLLNRYFQRNFSYQLGVEMRPNRDPVLQFLTEKRRGHCELFAASTALLLRSQGVPTRYVTGFVCAEPHPFSGHWLSRLEDAHAWVEAFVEEENAWVLVETTPASGIPEGMARFNWFSAAFDGLAIYWKELLARLKRGYAAETITGGFFAFMRALRWLFLHPARGPLCLMVTLSITYAWQQRRRQRQVLVYSDLPEAIAELQRQLGRVKKHLRRFGVESPPTVTPRELAAEIRRTAQIGRREQLLALLEEYEYLRYGGRPPATEAIDAFTGRARQVLRRSCSP